MFIVPRQLLLTQWFFFVHPHQISSCACIAQFSKDTGCPRNYTCHRLLKVIFEFLNCSAWILFWPGCGKCFEAKNLGIHSQVLGNLFPFSGIAVLCCLLSNIKNCGCIYFVQCSSWLWREGQSQTSYSIMVRKNFQKCKTLHNIKLL